MRGAPTQEAWDVVFGALSENTGDQGLDVDDFNFYLCFPKDMHNTKRTKEERAELANSCLGEAPSGARIDKQEFQRLVMKFARTWPAAGGGDANMWELHGVLEELGVLKSLFTLWASLSGKPELDHVTCSLVLSLFNQLSDKVNTQHGEVGAGRAMISYYDRGFYGATLGVREFCRWLWDETRVLNESFGLDFRIACTQLRDYLLAVKLFRLWDLGDDGVLDVAEVNRMIDASNRRSGGDCLATYKPASGEQKLGVKDFARFLRDTHASLSGDRFGSLLDGLERNIRGEGLHAVLGLFQKYDVDSSGRISREHLKLVMTRLGAFLPEEIDVLLDSADKGSDGRIDYTAFSKWLACNPSAKAGG